jgi:hypothetical protein
MGKPEAGCPNSGVGDGRGDPNGSPLLEMATVAVIATKGGRAAGVAPTGPVSGSIGALMAQFKSRVTKRINTFRNNPGCPVWQRNYYERVIRNDDELSRAREYIVNNPMKWALDKENPVHCK